MRKFLLILVPIFLFSCSIKEEYNEQEDVVQVVEQIRYIDKVRYTDEFVIPTDFIAPMKEYSVSSKFGFRTHPLGGEEFDLHKGVDLVGPKNSKIMAAQDGVVVIHFPPPNGHYKGHPVYGGLVIIDHGNGIFTLYGHFKATYVREGQKVKKGDIIGMQGSTGVSTGPHLHFEIVVDPAIALK